MGCDTLTWLCTAKQLNKTPVAGASRTVQLEGGRAAEGFATNDIKTAKYNPATFLPKFLWEMFSRAAYLYFLFQVPAARLTLTPTVIVILYLGPDLCP